MKSFKIIPILVMCMLFGFALQAQKHESEAAVINFSVDQPAGLAVGSTTKFKIEVTPKAGWHVYSAIPSEDGAYMQAELGWEIDSRGFEAAAKVQEEGGMVEMYDDIMAGMMRYYKGNVTFSQELKVTETEVILVGYFDYMACNEAKCIPLGAKFKLSFTAAEN